jgi:hypothetical protein
MSGIPHALDTDTEDVTWALQTAEALWKRNERVDALVWLRRAAQAAGEAEDDDRALELAHDAAELAEWMGPHPRPAGPSRTASALSNMAANTDAFLEPRTTQTDEVEEVSVEVALDSGPALMHDSRDTPTLAEEPVPEAASTEPVLRSLPAPMPPPRAPRVPSAAEKHAGMLDPWAEGEARIKVPEVAHKLSSKPGSASRTFDVDEVVTSAPPIDRPASPALRLTPPARPSVRSKPPAVDVDLSGVDALSDLPDDARDAFARTAVVREMSRSEEIAGFALALIIDGSVDLAATIVDTPAQRLEAGEVIRARGTLDHIAPVRLVAASKNARVATWDDLAVTEAFRTCPWVEDDLRSAGDRLQALVGVTMGPLGERLDPVLRAQVATKLTLRALTEHEVFAARGKPIPGLLVVGAGELELLSEDGTPDGRVLRAGDFLFPQEVLLAGPAPCTVRAAKGGALVLFADRHAAQELLVTCPPLLEIFASM